MEKMIYRVLNACLISCICLFGVFSYFGMKEQKPVLFGAMLCTVLLCTGITYLKMRGRILLCVGVLGCLILGVLLTGVRESVDFLRGYLDWMIGRPGWNEAYIGGFEIIMAIFFTLGCYMLACLSERYALVKRIFAGLLALLLLVSLFRGDKLSHIGTSLIIWFIVMTCVEWIQMRWNKVRNADYRMQMLWLMPFMVLYLIVLLLMPAPEKAYDWQFVKTAYNKASVFLTEISRNLFSKEREDFDTETVMSGFSEEAVLRDGISESNQKIMTIQSSPGLITNIYLDGKVFDTFDGRTWQQTDAATDEERLLDALETRYAVDRYQGKNVVNYIYSTEIKLQYLDFWTGCLFAPLKTYTISTPGKPLSYHQEGGSLRFEDEKGYGTEYLAKFYQMNVDHPEFYEMLEAGLEEDKTVWDELALRNKSQNGSVFSMDDLQLHRQYIYETYLPEQTISEQAKNYLKEMTEGAKTDIEKLKMIERELSSIPYTKAPGKFPNEIDSSADFLDYFLFENRQGYCTYFATAFVLLAREEGFPARYVQGFCVPVNKGRETTVYSNMAHAWPEVYIDGVGWIPFEPTPGYDTVRYTPWKMKEGEDTSPSGYENAKHYWEDARKDAEEQQLLIEEAQEKQEKQEKLQWILGCTVLLLILAGLLMVCLDAVIGRYRYKKKNAEQRFITEILRGMRILFMLGVARNSDETLQEFAERAGELTGMKERKAALHFLFLYEELLYGSRKITEEDIHTVKENQEQLCELLKQKTGRAYFLFAIRLSLFKYR